MFLGQFFLGQFVRVPYAAASNTGVPSQPAAAPIIAFYGEDGTKILAGRMPPLDPIAAVGLFSFTQQLDEQFEDEGHFVAHVTDGSYSEVHRFQILPGGNAGGAVISQRFYSRPEADFIVGKLDSDKRFIARNPVEI